MSSFLWGVLGGFIAWFITWFLTQPLSTFFGLRVQAAEALARYEDQLHPDPDAPPPSSEWLLERKKAYETCGASLSAFAVSNAAVAALLYSWPKVLPRYYARSAGSSLLTLSGISPGSEAADQVRRQVVSALKLNYWPYGMHRRRKV